MMSLPYLQSHMFSIFHQICSQPHLVFIPDKLAVFTELIRCMVFAHILHGPSLAIMSLVITWLPQCQWCHLKYMGKSEFCLMTTNKAIRTMYIIIGMYMAYILFSRVIKTYHEVVYCYLFNKILSSVILGSFLADSWEIFFLPQQTVILFSMTKHPFAKLFCPYAREGLSIWASF